MVSNYTLVFIVTTAAVLSFSSLSAAQGAQEQSNHPCNICGQEGIVTNPDAVMNIDGTTIQDKMCEELVIDGENGRIPASTCDLIQLEAKYVCDCQIIVVAPSPSPLSCQFCPNGITIDTNSNDDDDTSSADNDYNDVTLCQHLVNGARLISADSYSCEQLQAGEHICCNNDNLDDGSVMSMSYGLFYSYHFDASTHLSKGGKTKKVRAKTAKGKSRKSKVDGLIRARD